MMISVVAGLCVFGGGLLGVLVARIVSRVLGAGRARRIRRELGEAEPTSAAGKHSGAVANLEGVLKGPAGRVVTFYPWGVSLMEELTTHAESLVAPEHLRVDAIELAAPVQVLAGSIETPRAAHAADAKTLGVKLPRRGMLRVVRNGDRVVVRGLVEPVAASESAPYREPSVAFRLLPAPGTHAIPIVSAGAPRRPSRRLRASEWAAGLAAALLAAFGLLAFLWVQPAHVPVPAASSTSPAARPRCADEVDRALERGDPWAAATLSRTCAHEPTAALVALHLGEIEQASAAFERARSAGYELAPTIVEIEAHAMSGRNALARKVLQALRDARYRDAAPELERSLRCIEGALGRRAGQPDGAELLSQSVANAPRPDACGRLRDDFALYSYHPEGPDKVLVVMDRFPDELWNYTQDAETLRRLADKSGLSLAAATDPESRVRESEPALIVAALATRDRQDPHEATNGPRLDFALVNASLAEELALFHAYMGERADALKALAPVDWLAEIASEQALARYAARFGSARDGSEAVGRDEELRRQVFGYAAVVAMHAGDAERAALYLERSLGDTASAHLVAEITRQSTPGTAYAAPTVDHWHEALLASGASGDAEAVVKALRDGHTTGRGVLSRLVPKVTRNREALGRWAREQMPPACLRCTLFDIAANVADRREAARLVGDSELEARWATVARHYRDALLARDGAPVWYSLERATRAGSH